MPLIGLDFLISQLLMYVQLTPYPHHIMCEFRVLSSTSLKNKISHDMNFKKSRLLQSRGFKGKAHLSCRFKAKRCHLPRRVKRVSALSAIVCLYSIFFLSKFYNQCGAWTYHPKIKSCMLYLPDWSSLVPLLFHFLTAKNLYKRTSPQRINVFLKLHCLLSKISSVF